MAISPPIATASIDGNSASPSITHGFTIQSGDVIIATINANGGGNSVSDNNGANAFVFDDFGENPDSARYYVFHRMCGGSEPTTYSFTLGSSNRWSIVLRQYRGVHTDIWDVPPSASTRVSTFGDSTSELPSINIITSGACGLVLLGDDFLPTTTTFVSINNGYGNVRSESGQQYQVTADKLNLSTGATGITTITHSADADFVGYQVALKPASSGHLVTLNIISETDSLQSVIRFKRKALGVLAETNTIQTVGAIKSKILGLLVDTNSLQSVLTSKTKGLSLLTESNLSNTITVVKRKSLGLLTDFNLLLSMSLAKGRTLGLVEESIVLFNTLSSKSKELSLLEENQLLINVVGQKRKAIGLLEDTTLLHSLIVGDETVLGLLTETDGLQSIISSKRKVLGVLSDATDILPVQLKKVLSVGILEESDYIPSLVSTKRQSVGLLIESNSLFSIFSKKMLVLGQIEELDILLGLVKPSGSIIGSIIMFETDYKINQFITDYGMILLDNDHKIIITEEP